MSLKMRAEYADPPQCFGSRAMVRRPVLSSRDYSAAESARRYQLASSYWHRIRRCDVD